MAPLTDPGLPNSSPRERCGPEVLRSRADLAPLTLRAAPRRRLAGQCRFFRVADQRDEAVDAVHELAVGHGDEEAKTTPRCSASSRPMAGVSRSTSRARPVRLVRNSISDEGDVHAGRAARPAAPDRAAISRRAGRPARSSRPMPPSVPSTTGRSYQGYGASPAEGVVVERRDRGRGEAEQEAVEGEVVIEPAPVRRALVLVVAADAAAIEVAQLAGVAAWPARAIPARRAPARCAAPISRQKARTPMTIATMA